MKKAYSIKIFWPFLCILNLFVNKRTTDNTLVGHTNTAHRVHTMSHVYYNFQIYLHIGISELWNVNVTDATHTAYIIHYYSARLGNNFLSYFVRIRLFSLMNKSSRFVIAVKIIIVFMTERTFTRTENQIRQQII